MRQALLLSAGFLAAGLAAYFFWGGLGLMIAGIGSAIVCVSGMGVNQYAYLNPDQRPQPQAEEHSTPSLIKKEAFFWAAPAAFLVLVCGIFLLGKPPPLG